MPGSKVAILGMVIPPLIGNPYNGYINPYYWVDDHPLLYGNNGSLDPSTYSVSHLKLQNSPSPPNNPASKSLQKGSRSRPGNRRKKSPGDGVVVGQRTQVSSDKNPGMTFHESSWLVNRDPKILA